MIFDFENKEIREGGRKIGEISAVDSRAEDDIVDEIENRSESLSNFRDDFLYGNQYTAIWNYIDKHDNKLSETLRKLADRIEYEL